MDDSKPLRAGALSNALKTEDILTSDRTLKVVFNKNSKPEVTFTGFWNGRFIRVATNAIAKAYRLRRLTKLRR